MKSCWEIIDETAVYKPANLFELHDTNRLHRNAKLITLVPPINSFTYADNLYLFADSTDFFRHTFRDNFSR